MLKEAKNQIMESNRPERRESISKMSPGSKAHMAKWSPLPNSLSVRPGEKVKGFFGEEKKITSLFELTRMQIENSTEMKRAVEKYLSIDYQPTICKYTDSAIDTLDASPLLHLEELHVEKFSLKSLMRNQQPKLPDYTTNHVTSSPSHFQTEPSPSGDQRPSGMHRGSRLGDNKRKESIVNNMNVSIFQHGYNPNDSMFRERYVEDESEAPSNPLLLPLLPPLLPNS